MKKLAAAALILGTLSTGSVWAHEAGEFFIRAGTATVRPTEGSDNVLGSLGSFNVSNNTQLGLTFTYMATDNIGVELLAATPFRHKVGLDYLINRDWLLNMSVWYMDIDTDVKFKAGGVDQKVSTRLDPWVFMFSAGYRF